MTGPLKSPDAATVAALILEFFHLPKGYRLEDDQGPGSIPKWDSLGMLELINHLEERCGRTLELDDVAQIHTVADLKRCFACKS